MTNRKGQFGESICGRIGHDPGTLKSSYVLIMAWSPFLLCYNPTNELLVNLLIPFLLFRESSSKNVVPVNKSWTRSTCYCYHRYFYITASRIIFNMYATYILKSYALTEIDLCLSFFFLSFFFFFVQYILRSEFRYLFYWDIKLHLDYFTSNN